MSVIFLSPLSAKQLNVHITSPSYNAQFDACSDITITADVSGDEVRDVVFLYHTYRIKTDRNAPYECTWKDVPTGIYEITARARGKSAGTVYSEPVQIFVGDYEAGNLIINSQFDCGTIDPWDLVEESGGRATVDVVTDSDLSPDSTAAMIKIENTGTVDWGVQLEQKYALQPDHYYEIFFHADAPEPKQIRLELQSRTTWEVYWQQIVTVSEAGQYGPYEFDCTIDDDNTFFQFIVAYDTTTLYLDDVRVIDYEWTGVSPQRPTVAKYFQLYQNYPNPFNSGTTITFSLKRPQHVRLSVYNILGERTTSLVDGTMVPGRHTVHWNGRDDRGRPVNSGIYIYKLSTGDWQFMRKMVLVK